MPLRSYGVLKGKAIEVRIGAGSSPHYEVRLIDDTIDYRIAINVKSQLPPSDVEYIVIDHFAHPITALLEVLPKGYTALKPLPGTAAVDFIRGNLFDRAKMRPLPFSVPGFDNDLNEKLDAVMQRAVADEEALVYAFGERWGPEPAVKDKYFGFLPGNGIHDIHMNQGNSGQFVGDDGVYQDGAVLVHFPDQRQWTAIFLKFQSQAWHTDDKTGHRISAPAPQPIPIPPQPGPTPPPPPAPQPPAPQPPAPQPPPPPAPPLPPGPPTSDDPDGLVRIVGALVNSTQSPEVEIVTLLNTAPHDIPLTGWALLDAQKRRMPLSNVLKAGATVAIPIKAPLALSNKGGQITLLDEQGLKVHGVAYTKEQAQNPGWTIVF